MDDDPPRRPRTRVRIGAVVRPGVTTVVSRIGAVGRGIAVAIGGISGAVAVAIGGIAVPVPVGRIAITVIVL